MPGQEQRYRLSLHIQPAAGYGAGPAALGGMNREISPAQGRLSAEFMAARERDTWVPIGPGEQAFVTCGDDRGVTDKSAGALMRAMPRSVRDPRDVTHSIFGSLSGMAKIALVAGVAQRGHSFIEQAGGFYGVMERLAIGSPGPLTQHSADSAEDNPEVFNPRSNKAVNCKYNQLLGATAVLLGKQDDSELRPDSLIQAVARRDQIDIFGDDNGVDRLMAANTVVARHLAALNGGDANTFAVGRAEYARLQQPTSYRPAVKIAVLAGEHLPSSQTGVISNYSLTEGGRAGKAYRLDIASVTGTILAAIPAYRLGAEAVMRAIQLDSTPVRAALAGESLDPNGLAMGWRGDPWDAIAELNDRHNG